MRYAALIDAHGDRLVAEFPDCPGCQASAGTPADVAEAARAALHRWLESCLVEGTIPPRPSVAVVSRDWFEWIDVEPDLARRLLLRWAVAKRISRGELARRAGSTEDAIAALQDERVQPSPELLDGVARALGVVGGSARVPAPAATPRTRGARSKDAARTTDVTRPERGTR
jgi:predicted RNase H-like HicB family nuclease